MDITKAYELGLSLMIEHKLFDWEFKLDRAKRRFGVCKYRKKLITLSSPLIELNSEEQVKDTILHEIAHALVGPKHGHDYIWKMKAKEIGCKPERCYGHDVIQPQGKYVSVCNTCGNIRYKHKLPKRNHSCGKCSNKYNEKYLLHYEPLASFLLKQQPILSNTQK